MTKSQIYQRELDKLLDAGDPDAHRKAAELAEEIYWDLVDRGREQAKERSCERS